MPNTRRQIVGPLDDLGGVFLGARGVFLQGSDGRTVTVTRIQILAHFATEIGTLLLRKLKTFQWLKDQITSSLGTEQVPDTAVSGDFDSDTGDVTGLTVEG